MSLAILCLALAGCTAAGPRSASTDDALTRELAGRVAGEPQSCVSISPSNGLVIIDDNVLAYRSGGTTWINRVDGCHAIEPLNTLIVEVHGSQYCRGDRVRGREFGASIPGPYCILREFTPYRRAEGG